MISDGYKGTMAGIDYLFERGRKRIGYVKGPSKVYVTKERFRGYRRALSERGVAFDPRLVYEGDFTIASGYEGARRLVESGGDIDAIMAVNDMMAVGVIKYLNAMRIRIPQDINVIGFDNIPLCEIVEPSLTTIAQPIGLLGETAARIIVDSIAERGGAAPDARRQIVLETELIARGSTS